MTTDEGGLTENELAEMERLVEAASSGPWEAFVEGRDHVAGDDFIRTGGMDDASPDMYVTLYYDAQPVPAPAADLDFIAGARQAIPLLVAEVRRLRDTRE